MLFEVTFRPPNLTGNDIGNTRFCLREKTKSRDIGHTRPWMSEGLPMEEALTKLKEIEEQIEVLMRTE